MRIINVSEDDYNLRIDKYLIKELGYTRSKIQKLIKDGKILVNDKQVKNNYMVKIDDDIVVDDESEPVINIKPEKISLDIVYEDDDLIVVNKPSGMVVHPAFGHYQGTLVNALMYYCQQLSNINGIIRPGIVHRLDKDTSGLLLVAKNDQSHLSLAEQLKTKKVIRKYIALVHGVIPHDSGTIDAPIGRDKIDRQKMTVTEINAKEAVTHFNVLERLKDATLIECQLETGRTHQIRVHMQYIGYPIVNDAIYGYKKTINQFGQLLHAHLIGFYHPKNNRYMEFSVSVPNEFTEIVNMFR
jgi:23S rRNA pseudouridine1911/1915/1917 synthase